MRLLNAILCALLTVFALVQHNDPDWYFWIPVYALPALWSGLASWRPGQVARPGPLALLGVCLLAAIGGALWLWPGEPGFWRQEVWWRSETAREGLGMLIVVVALTSAGAAALRARSAGS